MLATDSPTVTRLLSLLPEFKEHFARENAAEDGEMDPHHAMSELGRWWLPQRRDHDLTRRVFDGVDVVFCDPLLPDGRYLSVEFFEFIRSEVKPRSLPPLKPASRRWFEEFGT